MLDDFKMGPNLVRGFQPAGLGPRDITPGTTGDNIGGTMYWGASLEFQYPFYFLPKDSGFKGAVFVDSRIGVGLQGRDHTIRQPEKSTAWWFLRRRNTPFVCQCGMHIRRRSGGARVGRRQSSSGIRRSVRCGLISLIRS